MRMWWMLWEMHTVKTHFPDSIYCEYRTKLKKSEKQSNETHNKKCIWIQLQFFGLDMSGSSSVSCSSGSYSSKLTWTIAEHVNFFIEMAMDRFLLFRNECFWRTEFFLFVVAGADSEAWKDAERLRRDCTWKEQRRGTVVREISGGSWKQYQKIPNLKITTIKKFRDKFLWTISGNTSYDGSFI